MTNPLNLALRFLLEVAALGALGYWGWERSHGIMRLVLGIGLPILAAVVWATFRVPGESPSGHAPVPVPGAVRLLLEFGLFGCAIWALFDAEAARAGWILAAATCLHYALSYERMIWLVRQ